VILRLKFWTGLFLLSLFVFSLVACNQISSQTTTSTDSLTSSSIPEVQVLSEDSLENTDYVRWIGRTSYDDVTKKMNFYYTGTGFTVTFFGTSLSISIDASNTSSSSRRPYFTMSLDEQVAPEGTVFYLTKAPTDLTLVEGLEEGIHTVTFLKRSEPTDSETAITNIETDGFFLSPTEASNMKFLIIGGSGISGHGNLGTAGQARTTANSDSLQAFGYLTAKAFDGDFQFVSASGWGLVWGYNSSNRNGTVSIRDAFDKVGIGDNQELIDIDYDPTLYVPDYIIVNIGGNDFDSYISHLEGADLISAKAIFRAAVTEFCSTLHELYPNAYILWTHTGSQNGTEASAAIGDLDPKHRYTRVFEIKQVGEDGDPVGADGHAGLITHQKNADICVAIIQEIIASIEEK